MIRRLVTKGMPRLILNPKKPGDIQIKGVVFDMDGTLCLPQTWMFQQMRNALGIDKGTDILDHVNSLPEKAQAEAQEKLMAIERKAMGEMIPQPGLQDLMMFLNEKGIPKSICTRNFPIPVEYLLSNFLDGHTLHPVITREFKPPKPHPAGILHIAKEWGIDPRHLVMVGDSVDDMTAGHRAGAGTILLQSDVNTHLNGVPETDVVVHRLHDVIKVLEEGFEAKVKNSI
ncbi:hypothetical protein TRVA0_012S02058 [Trichomonascus vanleenenianus]|uniref:putative haloacid dehalogenase-like hydrolase n=1 Tax=Trichomonascus vanleenenianus TaxID=2268995 RepID=UPI003ECABC6B